MSSPQIKLVDRWHEGFDKRDISILAETLHKDFVGVTHPKSLNQKDLGREEWLGQMKQALESWTSLERTTHSLIEADGTVIIHYSGIAHTKFNYDMQREAITIAHIAPDDEGNLKFKKVEEFVDSKTHLESLKGLDAIFANLKK